MHELVAEFLKLVCQLLAHVQHTLHHSVNTRTHSAPHRCTQAANASRACTHTHTHRVKYFLTLVGHHTTPSVTHTHTHTLTRRTCGSLLLSVGRVFLKCEDQQLTVLQAHEQVSLFRRESQARHRTVKRKRVNTLEAEREQS